MFDIDPVTFPKQLFFDNKYIDLSESDFVILQKTAKEVLGLSQLFHNVSKR